MNRTLACSLVVLGLGCKGKPTHHEPPANSASGSGSAVGSAQGSATAGTGSDTLVLPKGDGSPPKTTKAPLSPEMIKKLRGLTFPGFAAAAQDTRADTVVVEFHTNDRPKLKATVQIQPCNGACLPLELPRWEKLPELKELLPAELRTASDTVFQVEATDLNATPMIDTYQIAMGASGGGMAYSDTYILYFNDNMTKIRVVAMYADNKPDSREHMVKMAPKEDLEHLAKAFMDAYTQAWVE